MYQEVLNRQHAGSINLARAVKRVLMPSEQHWSSSRCPCRVMWQERTPFDRNRVDISAHPIEIVHHHQEANANSAEHQLVDVNHFPFADTWDHRLARPSASKAQTHQ